MENEFIPYEQALELKELGFDEPCVASWDETTMKDTQTGKETPIIALNQLNGYKQYNSDHDYNKSLGSKSGISAPLYQQAFRWFREKYGLCSWITMELGNKSTFCWVLSGEHTLTQYAAYFYTYEEAEQACLDKLIEIVKNDKRIK
jgi:hypothetical protein